MCLYLDGLRRSAQNTKGAAAAAMPKKVLEAFEYARSRRKGPTRMVTVLIRVISEVRDYDVAMAFLQHMRNEGMSLSPAQTLKIIEMGISRNSLTVVSPVLDEATKLGYRFNEGTLLNICNLLSRKGDFERLLQMEKLLAEQFPDSQPSEAFYRLALHATTKFKTIKLVIPKDAEKQKLEAFAAETPAATAPAAASADTPAATQPTTEDAPVSDAAPEETRKSKRDESTVLFEKVPWQALFELLHRMQDRGINLEVPLIRRRLLSPFKDAETIDEAYYALEDMHKSGVPIRIYDLKLIIRACNRNQDLERAFATFAELGNFGLQPDAETYRDLLSVCYGVKNFDAVRHVRSQMTAAGFQIARERPAGNDDEAPLEEESQDFSDEDDLSDFSAAPGPSTASSGSSAPRPRKFGGERKFDRNSDNNNREGGQRPRFDRSQGNNDGPRKFKGGYKGPQRNFDQRNGGSNNSNANNAQNKD